VAYAGCKVACRDHGWTIDLASGEVEHPERGRVRTFPVQVRDGQVFVDLA
jgi:nitrite reductase/ring-hydroxylating ferredoxin subunit